MPVTALEIVSSEKVYPSYLKTGSLSMTLLVLEENATKKVQENTIGFRADVDAGYIRGTHGHIDDEIPEVDIDEIDGEFGEDAASIPEDVHEADTNVIPESNVEYVTEDLGEHDNSLAVPPAIANTEIVLACNRQLSTLVDVSEDSRFPLASLRPNKGSSTWACERTARFNQIRTDLLLGYQCGVSEWAKDNWPVYGTRSGPGSSEQTGTMLMMASSSITMSSYEPEPFSFDQDILDLNVLRSRKGIRAKRLASVQRDTNRAWDEGRQKSKRRGGTHTTKTTTLNT
ncbi:hypothetical protein T440DRAFT_518852 [Plenodomus tracheiphilus IPT5]|uniref:Uncharacterized protein n=1 Tax=Plenodomus tracheiphilus IPT5 TaxID=1408161 RepID=A0A6A7B3D1_9PLEO|nr:hypothetical protein T440DRAFT_518852 [Plenodomus tracheiphilus IPT5]